MKAQIIKLDPQKEMPVIGVKIIDEKYADGFINNGIIHFSNPSIWRNPELCNGKQLDKDEGCFCYSVFENDKLYEKCGRRYKREFRDEGWKYFEEVDDIVGSCFYGISRSDFYYIPMKYGVKEIPSLNYSVPYEYFQDFNDTYSSGEIKKTVIIYDLWRFFDLIIDKAEELGASKEEIYISPVYYVNKHIPFCTLEDFPFEFFLKDDSFSKQSELRIIIASSNKVFYKHLNENGNNLILGDISSFSVLQDKYNFDLDFSIQNEQLIYKLATPITTTLEQRSFKKLVGELYQIKQNRLPGLPKTQKEIDELATPIIEHLKTKYGVVFKDDWRLYNVPYKEYLTLPELYKGLCMTVIDDRIN